LAYADNLEKKKQSSKIASKVAYADNPEKKKTASKMAYEENAEKRKNDFKDNYGEHREEICSKKRDQYVLRAPNEGFVNTFVESLLSEFLRDAELKVCLTTKLHIMYRKA